MKRLKISRKTYFSNMLNPIRIIKQARSAYYIYNSADFVYHSVNMLSVSYNDFLLISQE